MAVAVVNNFFAGDEVHDELVICAPSIGPDEKIGLAYYMCMRVRFLCALTLLLLLLPLLLLLLPLLFNC